MKRLCLFMLMCLLSGAWAYSQDFSTSQKRLRSDIVTYLQEEGYMPEIDSDGDVKFKKGGLIYYVLIDKRDETPMYLSIALFYDYDATFTKERIAASLFRLNLKKGVKVLGFDNRYSYRAEMYLTDAQQFKGTFNKLIAQLGLLRSELEELCNQGGPAGAAGGYGSGGGDGGRSVTASFDSFFPLYGFVLGKTTVKELEKRGIKNEKNTNYNYARINKIAVYDWNNDRIYEDMYLSDFSRLPAEWEEKFGFEWSLSYTEWMRLFERLGFEIKVTKAPAVEKEKGRKFLRAEFIATSENGDFSFRLNFKEGNKEGEGYGVDSKNSLFSIDVEC